MNTLEKEHELLSALHGALVDGHRSLFNFKICSHLRGYNVTNDLDIVLDRVKTYVEHSHDAAAIQALEDARSAWGGRVQDAMMLTVAGRIYEDLKARTEQYETRHAIVGDGSYRNELANNNLSTKLEEVAA